MPEGVMSSIAEFYLATHRQVLRLVERVDDEVLAWSPNPTTPSIRFHLWHLARWADYLQAMIGGSSLQEWEAAGLASAWGLDPARSGFAQTGMGLAPGRSNELPLPGTEVLLGYVRAAFSRADQVVRGLGDDQFHSLVPDPYEVEGPETEIGEAVLNWLKHDNRHLGMIECLLGVQGRIGTATR